MTLAQIEHAGPRARLIHCARHAADGEDWPALLGHVEDQAELRRVPVSGVLAAGAYQLLLVERPDVPDAEIAAAVRWRIRELLNFPAQEAVVDVFDIPPPRRAQKPMVYAVAARGTIVQRQVDALTGAGFTIDALDIPELCLRNVATSLPQDAQGLALLHFEADHGVLSITRNGVLYLLRRIETGRVAIEEAISSGFTLEGLAGEIALELQRSLDYFESHYDQRPIVNLVLDPGMSSVFVEALGGQLGISVAALDLNTFLEMPVTVPAEEQAQYMVAIGAALRSDRALEVAA